MTEIEKKALELVNEAEKDMGLTRSKFLDTNLPGHVALYRALEELKAENAACAAERKQHEAFRQEVSDAVEEVLTPQDDLAWEFVRRRFARFIIAKPDPLVEAMKEVWLEDNQDASERQWQEDAEVFRAAMKARGYEWTKIVEDK